MFNSVPTWIEISQKAFEHNIAVYKKIVGPHVDLALVVKSNAYGHGLDIIAQLCEKNPHVGWLCVSSLSEGLMLRKQGITKPILVMSVIDSDPVLAIQNNIDLVAFDPVVIAELNERAKALDKPINIHLKMDTGLARLGFRPDQRTIDDIKSIAALPYISLRGIFSHFAEPDGDETTYSDLQREQFVAFINNLERDGLVIPYKHMSNSAGTSSINNSHFNLVRIGAGVYGLELSVAAMDRSQKNYPYFGLQAVMTWKTYLMHIRTVPAESYVGYGRTYKTLGTTRIGIIPIGYYEGYDRRHSNNGTVLICSKKNDMLTYSYAPILGRVCMNVSMIDLTGIDVCLGDEVIILGAHQGVQARDMANAIQSFNPREVTTRLSPAIHRMLVP